jgi:hypothetical protein
MLPATWPVGSKSYRIYLLASVTPKGHTEIVKRIRRKKKQNALVFYIPIPLLFPFSLLFNRTHGIVSQSASKVMEDLITSL